MPKKKRPEARRFNPLLSLSSPGIAEATTAVSPDQLPPPATAPPATDPVSTSSEEPAEPPKPSSPKKRSRTPQQATTTSSPSAELESPEVQRLLDSGKRVSTNLRLPQALTEAVDAIARETTWTKTDLISCGTAIFAAHLMRRYKATTGRELPSKLAVDLKP